MNADESDLPRAIIVVAVFLGPGRCCRHLLAVSKPLHGSALGIEPTSGIGVSDSWPCVRYSAADARRRNVCRCCRVAAAKSLGLVVRRGALRAHRHWGCRGHRVDGRLAEECIRRRDLIRFPMGTWQETGSTVFSTVALIAGQDMPCSRRSRRKLRTEKRGPVE